MMTDDGLYGLVTLAYELRVSFQDILAMPNHELVLWSVFFERRRAQEQIRRASNR